MTVETVSDLHTALTNYWEGAHFCRMDLHTHGPASECCDYWKRGLPRGLDTPATAKVTTARRRVELTEVIQRLAAGELRGALVDGDPLKGIIDGYEQARDDLIEGLSPDAEMLVDPGPLPAQDLRRLGQVWRAELAVAPDDLLKRARVDLVALLLASIWPVTYVVRLHLEELEIVALTDHNHPGYIAMRVPELGTWYGRASRVNARFTGTLSGNGGDPNAVREVLIKFARKGQVALGGGEVGGNADAKTTSNHRGDKPAPLKGAAARLQHAIDRENHWTDIGNPMRPITLLPGTEITVNNVHCLSIYPPEFLVESRIATVLRSMGIPDHHWGRGFYAAASTSVQTTIERVSQQGGVVIPAHCNNDFKGLLRLFPSGIARDKVLSHPGLIALETIGGSLLMDAKRRGMNAAKSLRYIEESAKGALKGKQLALTKGSDAHDCRLEVKPTGHDLGERFTWIKADLRPRDNPTEIFRALRLALMSGPSRVVEHPTEDTYNYSARGQKTAWTIPKEERTRLVHWQAERPAILGLVVDGGHAGGLSKSVASRRKLRLQVRLNPYLNCVVGDGGKSTFVRLIGWAMGKLSFTPGTPSWWLPRTTWLFWSDGDRQFCGVRTGAHIEPSDATATVHELIGGVWTEHGDASALESLCEATDVWPPPDVLAHGGRREQVEEKTIAQLAAALMPTEVPRPGPLLVVQPDEIFNSAELFERVLRRPGCKYRQIVWSTGSPSVPAAFDAEKVFVMTEVRDGRSSKTRMELVVAGDLHEDSLRREYLDKMEGGIDAFKRRLALYTM